MTPIDPSKLPAWMYFEREVINLYLAEPNRYEVEDTDFDGSIESRLPEPDDIFVSLRFDKRLSRDGRQLLVPFLHDFAKLPARHLSHWKSHEVHNPDLVPLDDDAAFVAAYRQNYLGEFVDWPPKKE